MTKEGFHRHAVPGASRLASDVFDSNRLRFYAYKRAWPLAELGYASVAVGAFGRVIRGRERLSCAAVLLMSLDTSSRVHGPVFRSKSLPYLTH